MSTLLMRKLSLPSCDDFSHSFVPSRNGWAALHFAADSGQESCINALVKSGADVSIRDKCVLLHLFVRSLELLLY